MKEITLKWEEDLLMDSIKIRIDIPNYRLMLIESSLESRIKFLPFLKRGTLSGKLMAIAIILNEDGK